MEEERNMKVILQGRTLLVTLKKMMSVFTRKRAQLELRLMKRNVKSAAQMQIITLTNWHWN